MSFIPFGKIIVESVIKEQILKIIVRGYHCDYFGCVNNARYLEFLEEARWAYFDGKLDFAEWKQRGIDFFNVSITVNYRRAAYLGEELDVRTRVSKIGNKSTVLRQEIWLDGTDIPVLDADITIVGADSQTKKSVPVEGELREVMETLMLKPA